MQVDLDALDAIVGKATKGEMKYGIRRDCTMWFSVGDPLREHEAGDIFCSEELLAALTALKNAYPALAAELREARKALSNLDARDRRMKRLGAAAEVRRLAEEDCDTVFSDDLPHITQNLLLERAAELEAEGEGEGNGTN